MAEVVGLRCWLQIYEEPGVARGAADFQLGGTNNVELCTRPNNLAVAANPVGQERMVDAHKG